MQTRGQVGAERKLNHSRAASLAEFARCRALVLIVCEAVLAGRRPKARTSPKHLGSRRRKGNAGMGMLLQLNLKKLAHAPGALALALALASGTAVAEDGPTLSEPEISTHGFVSQGYIKTTSNNYLAETKGAGSFEFSEAGINVTAAVSDNLQLGAQLFARDLGPIGNYDAKFDWYYLDYRVADWLGVRAGRTKLPFGLYNESSDIDAARVPILLPQSVYPTENRDYLLAQTGAELYGYLSLESLGGLEYRLYGGTVFLELAPQAEISSFNVPYVLGTRLMWMNLLDGLQFGASVQALQVDGVLTPSPTTLGVLQAAGATIPDDFDGNISFKIPVFLWVGSVEYTMQNLQLAAEYSRWSAQLESEEPLLLPEETALNERYYVMANYHVAPWFTPGLYYAATYPDARDRHGRGMYQHDVAATFRYDLTEHWLLKLEGHFMHGTANLQPALNDQTPRGRMRTDWGAFLVKTTAYF